MIFKLSVLLVLLMSLINQCKSTDSNTKNFQLQNNQPKFVLFRSFNQTKDQLIFDGRKKHDKLLRLSKIGHGQHQKSDLIFQPAYKIARKTQKKRSPHGISQIKSIYKTLKNGNKINNDPLINTIRYVPSIKVDSDNKLYFLFNLSHLTSSERVFKSEMYINKRYIRQRLTFDLHYFFYSTLKSDGRKNSGKKAGASMTIDLRNFNAGRNLNFGRQNQWEAFNMLDSVREYLKVRGRNNDDKVNRTNLYYTFNNNENLKKSNEGDELVLIMEATSFGRNRRRRHLIDNLNPYLIIYSNENDQKQQQFFESRITQKLEAQMMMTKKPIEVNADLKEIDELKKFEDQVDDLNELDVVESSSSSSSSVVPEKSILLADYLIEKSGAHQKIKNHYDDYLANTDKVIYGNYRNNRLQKRDLSSNEMGVFDESKWMKLDEVDEKEVLGKCVKKPMLVDFIDMSFNDWIIEPKRFQSSFCSGSCKFPSNKKITFSNYGTIQSILNSLKFVNSPPAELCCTPTSTSSLPILYTDLNGKDTVVKLLPDMIVNDCLCH